MKLRDPVLRVVSQMSESGGGTTRLRDLVVGREGRDTNLESRLVTDAVVSRVGPAGVGFGSAALERLLDEVKVLVVTSSLP